MKNLTDMSVKELLAAESRIWEIRGTLVDPTELDDLIGITEGSHLRSVNVALDRAGKAVRAELFDRHGINQHAQISLLKGDN